ATQLQVTSGIKHDPDSLPENNGRSRRNQTGQRGCAMTQDELCLPPAATVVPAARAPHRLRRGILYASATLLASALSAPPFHIEPDTLLTGVLSAMAKDGGPVGNGGGHGNGHGNGH